jgi:ABC-type antimicrobial peptide transport system permease subunit
MVRVSGDAELARREIERTFDAANPRELIPTYRLETMVGVEKLPPQAASWIAGTLGVIALFLTASGVYGVLACLVAHRTREIGIRMALGATGQSVARLVLGQSGLLAAVGLLAGAGFAYAVMRLLGSQFPFDVDAFDLIAYVSAAIVVLAACLVASSVPTLRAVRVAPSETLRHD